MYGKHATGGDPYEGKTRASYQKRGNYCAVVLVRGEYRQKGIRPVQCTGTDAVLCVVI